MRNKSYALGAFMNTVTLTLGLVVGFLIGAGIREPSVSAQGSVPAATPAPTAQQASKQEVEEVAPTVSAGSAAFGTLLANRLASDEIASRGFDLLKLHENTLNLLASKSIIFTREEVQAIVNKSRAEKLLKMKQPEKPKEEK